MATKKTASKKVAPKKPVVAKATPPSPPASKKATPPKKQVVAEAKATPPPANKKAVIEKQLADLAAQIEALDAEAVEELKGKIGDTKKILRGYELELKELTGKRSATPKKARRASNR